MHLEGSDLAVLLLNAAAELLKTLCSLPLWCHNQQLAVVPSIHPLREQDDSQTSNSQLVVKFLRGT
jgi:hypothetical protein